MKYSPLATYTLDTCGCSIVLSTDYALDIAKFVTTNSNRNSGFYIAIDNNGALAVFNHKPYFEDSGTWEIDTNYIADMPFSGDYKYLKKIPAEYQLEDGDAERSLVEVDYLQIIKINGMKK